MDLSELQKDQPEQMVEQEQSEQTVPETPITPSPTPTPPKSFLSPDKEELRTRLQSYLDGATQEKLSPLALAGMAFSALGARSRGQQVTLRNLIDEHEGKRKQIAMQLLDRLNDEAQQASILAKQQAIEDARAQRDEDKAKSKEWTDRRAHYRAISTNKEYQKNPSYGEALAGMGKALEGQDEEGYLTSFNKLTMAQNETVQAEERRKGLLDTSTMEALRTGKMTPEQFAARMKSFNLDPADPANAQITQAVSGAYQQGIAEKQQAQNLLQARLRLQAEGVAIRQQAMLIEQDLRKISMGMLDRQRAEQTLLGASNALARITTQIGVISQNATLMAGSGQESAALQGFLSEANNTVNTLYGIIDQVRVAQDQAQARLFANPASGAPGSPNTTPTPAPPRVLPLTQNVISDAFLQATSITHAADPNVNLDKERSQWLMGESDDQTEMTVQIMGSIIRKMTGGKYTTAQIQQELTNWISAQRSLLMDKWRQYNPVERYLPFTGPGEAPAITNKSLETPPYAADEAKANQAAETLLKQRPPAAPAQ